MMLATSVQRWSPVADWGLDPYVQRSRGLDVVVVLVLERQRVDQVPGRPVADV